MTNLSSLPCYAGHDELEKVIRETLERGVIEDTPEAAAAMKERQKAYALQRRLPRAQRHNPFAR